MSGFGQGPNVCATLGVRTNYPHHLPGFSYKGRHRYFLTFCTDGRARHFTNQNSVDLVVRHFLRAIESQAMAVIVYCFMPDHVHLVTEGLEERSDLKQFIRLAKQYSGYYWSQSHDGQRLWQRYGYERVLRDYEATRDVVKYVLENPIRAHLTSTVEDYPFVGSTLYTRESLIEFALGSGEEDPSCPANAGRRSG